MTTSTTENREPAQATATTAGKPKPPHKARAAAKKGHAAASKARSTRQPRSAKKGAQPRRKAGNARPGSKTAKILDLVKRPGGATLQELRKATSWQLHSIRGFLSVLGKNKGVAVSLPSRRMGNALIRSKPDSIRFDPSSRRTVPAAFFFAAPLVPAASRRVSPADGNFVRECN